ncbi:E3 ubiquitin-protein ligase TRIM39-like isoform X1 [Sebastes umbrosus]|uniref:E3 ubiquitin-protein ligase TRIM39-like isoform X1 n=2 Tax=Sebastes umbrosus TaxID=72105 RepID=UPI00189C61FC|nr:E3 ubiquitin-protein ligase TRIM39-like isoform X1 [Sebastes umbrosus]
MSAASCLLTEDQFLCSICLDVFTDPVSTPCGHNFCKTCITQHWDINVPFQCPNCKEVFNTRPELRVNTFISEMAAQFRQSAQQKASSSSSEQQAAKPGEVPCDVCTGTKLKALKSCLVCLESYCETHLEPHLTRSSLKRHQLMDPVENLEGRMCTNHDKLLELFCKTDQMCVCMLCTVLDHKTHDVVPLKEEYEGKKAELGMTEAAIQQMIQKRRLKIQEMKHSVGLSKEDADREIADGVQVFTALKESVERSQAELIDTIKEKQRKKEKQAEGFIKKLEQEISELKKRSTEVVKLSRSEDHLHLLQSFTSLSAAPPTKNWTEVSVRPSSYEGTVVRAVNQLEETLSKQMKKLLEAELKRVQQGKSVDMSAASCLLTEDQFLCSICLDVFTDPVSTPCGHNFCKTCITQHWDVNVLFQCPNCKEVFNTRPELRVNTFISEMAAQFRQSAQQKASSSSSEQQAAKPGEVPCDVCTGTKLKALKSCLVCLDSYCETHLEPHLTRSGLKRHQLIDPVENLEGRMCTKHDKLLELFCKTDQMCVCMLCTVLDHKTHDVVPLKEEYEVKKAELGKTEAEIQQMIQKRRLKIQEMKHSVGLSKVDADREIADGVQVFTALKESVEKSQAELIDTIKEKQRKTEKQAEGFIKELEQEISELKKRSTEVEQLLLSEDHLHLLQSFTSLNAAPPTKDWTEVSVCSPSYEGTVVRAVNQLEETLSKQMKKLLAEAELKRVQKSAVDVTLDHDTAKPNLILSDDGKQVKYSDVKKNLPDNPERFDRGACVLAKQSFFSGRFYYEVQVKGKTKWDLGVARESINRKGGIKLTPQNGYWTICLRNENEYKACAGPSVCLSLKSQPEKVGVFVDYEEGLVSFYDVDAAALIYSFTGCSFTEKLYPYFGPCNNDGGKNSAPLIISPVNHTE